MFSLTVVCFFFDKWHSLMILIRWNLVVICWIMNKVRRSLQNSKHIDKVSVYDKDSVQCGDVNVIWFWHIITTYC